MRSSFLRSSCASKQYLVNKLEKINGIGIFGYGGGRGQFFEGSGTCSLLPRTCQLSFKHVPGLNVDQEICSGLGNCSRTVFNNSLLLRSCLGINSPNYIQFFIFTEPSTMKMARLTTSGINSQINGTVSQRPLEIIRYPLPDSKNKILKFKCAVRSLRCACNMHHL